MPLGEIVAGLFEIIGRFIGQIFFEIIFEIVIKGPGYLIVKALSSSRKKIEPDNFSIILAGFLFWIVLGCGAFGLYLIFIRS